MEKRALYAALLSAAVLILWFVLFPPTPPQPVESGPAVVPPTAAVAAGSEAAGREEAAVTAGPGVQRGAGEERISLAGQGWTAVVSSLGGAVESLVLSEYRDDAGQPLEMVSAGAARPLSLGASGPWNDEPYVVERDGERLVLRWSDGAGSWVEKRLQAGKGAYGLEFEVEGGGRAVRDGVVVGSGRAVKQASAGGFGSFGGVVRVDGEFDRLAAGKLDVPKELRGTVQFAGAEDHYFLLALLPEGTLEGVRLGGRKLGGLTVAEVVALGGSKGVKGTIYAGPKDQRILAGYGRGLDETLSFGFFGFLSVAFLSALRWINGWAGNWGVAIIVLTAAIRLLLFPLTHKSTVAMRRMQVVQPKMKAIQDRYKDRAKKDPNVRNRMNQEIMALYKQEGVNPMGGCLPLLVQLPILWALYTVFANAIELRHAPFFLWVNDLSIPDTLVTLSLGGFALPLRPLALLMGASMFLQQKMAPQVGDPAQRKIFMMMPIIFTFMFYSFPSGLVLYWFVNNVLTIGQQVLTERLMQRTAPAQ